MIRKLFCTALALGFSLGMLLAADAFTGTWTLDPAKSTFASDTPAPNALTLTLAEQDGTRTEIRKRIAADGSETSTSWTAPMTGGTVTFPAGQGPNGGAALTVVDERTLVMAQTTRNGRGRARRTYQVSADGQTLTLIQIREDGQQTARMVFTRQ